LASLPEPGEDISAVLSTQPVSLKPPAEFLTSFPGTRKIGEVITSGDLTLSVLGWESVPDDRQGMNLPKDMKYVVVELAAANNGKKTHVNYDWLIGLKDITGRNYDDSLLPNRNYSQMGMPHHIAPGEQMRGKTSFHVPKEVNDLVLFIDFYNPDTSSNDHIRVFIKLGEKPVTVPPPSQFSGEQSVQVHAVGESVQMGSFLLTVTKIVNNGIKFPKFSGLNFLIHL